MLINEHEQSTLQELGSEACYMLVVKKIAELETGHKFNPVEVYETGVAKGWIQPNCLMVKAEAVIGWLTGEEWEKVYVAIGQPLPAGAVYIVGCFVRKTGAARITHFVLLDKNLQLWYNPLVYSKTVEEGELESLRVFIKKVQP